MATIRLKHRLEQGAQRWVELRVDHVAAVEPVWLGGRQANPQQQPVPGESVLTLCTGRELTVVGYSTELLLSELKQRGW